jgi:xanthine dehydrogenase accessory factor
MDNLDLEVLRLAARWVREGYRCQLVTVIKTWGSSPRPEGAMLAIRDDGRVVGSVSGGCVEDDLIESVRRDGVVHSLPEIVSYGITAEQAHRFGLPCGGTIQLAIEPLGLLSRLDDLLERLMRRELVARRVNLLTGEAQLSSATSGMQLELAVHSLTTIHGPRWRLLVIGGGQLSRFLGQVALGLDYHVTICDPREEYAHEWDGTGIDLSREMPDDLILAMRPDARTAVLALTHDPKLDDMALMEALRSDAFYVGAIGSRVNNARRRERLKLLDLSETEIARLHGPVGIYIGSKTPAEIAISILAELTAVRNAVVVPPGMQVAQAKQMNSIAA